MTVKDALRALEEHHITATPDYPRGLDAEPTVEICGYGNDRFGVFTLSALRSLGGRLQDLADAFENEEDSRRRQ